MPMKTAEKEIIKKEKQINNYFKGKEYTMSLKTK